jgi:hypothetical protein
MRNELCVLESGNLSRIFYRGGGCDVFVRYGKRQTRGSRMREVAYRHMYWFRCCVSEPAWLFLTACYSYEKKIVYSIFFCVVENPFPRIKGIIVCLSQEPASCAYLVLHLGTFCSL